jgi:hypothetical protein
MKFFFLFASLMILPFISASELRSESGRDGKDKHSIGKQEVGSMSIVGTFPSNPVYGSLSFYENGCGTPLTQVKTVVTDVCFTNGGTSTKYTCSKYVSSSPMTSKLYSLYFSYIISGSSYLTEVYYSDAACTTVSSTGYAYPDCSDIVQLYSCTSNPFDYSTTQAVVATT